VWELNSKCKSQSSKFEKVQPVRSLRTTGRYVRIICKSSSSSDSYQFSCFFVVEENKKTKTFVGIVPENNSRLLLKDDGSWHKQGLCYGIATLASRRDSKHVSYDTNDFNMPNLKTKEDLLVPILCCLLPQGREEKS
jgi:hypothetical protein